MVKAVKGVFVAGTDTGVGKTLVATLLLRALGAQGWRTAAMKPVAAGASRHGRRLVNADVEQLRAAANVRAPVDLVNPYCFSPPVAPHIAAAESGAGVSLARIRGAYRELARVADIVVVEGAGGLLVPLGPRSDTADIVRVLDLPVLLVVGLRLGCINHALLTVNALQTRGLRLAGWIANTIAPRMLRRRENIEALRERIDAPLLGIVPHARTHTRQELVQSLDTARIFQAISE